MIHAVTTGARFVVVHTDICGSSRFVVFVSVNWLVKVFYQALQNHLGSDRRI